MKLIIQSALPDPSISHFVHSFWMLDNKTGKDIPRPQYHFPLDQSWAALPNLTMLGDAAHRMPPYAGEGVNQAMKDALELTEALTESNFKNIADAMTSFEKKMCGRASEITAETLENTERMHSENSLKIMLEFFNHNHVTQE